MRKTILAAVAFLALSGPALAQGYPPPAPPVYDCEPPLWAWRYAGQFCDGYARGFRLKMERYRAELDYWRALHDYRPLGEGACERDAEGRCLDMQ